MFFGVKGYEPCGIFTKGHFVLIFLTIIGIVFALKFSVNKNKKQVHKIIRNATISMWILEIIKIIYSISQNSLYKVNTYVPLYFCSILLYAGLLSSFGKGKLKRAGDVFLTTGSIIGGITFIIYPSTSLLKYPAFHILSIHSFVFHGMMIYLGLLMNITKYIELNKRDIKYFASLIGVICIMALIVNNIFNSNLMFVSQKFRVAPIEFLYKITKGSFWFNVIMMLGQMTMPFYLPYYCINKVKSLHKGKAYRDVGSGLNTVSN